MKKIFFLALFVSNSLLSQNGFTSYPMPTGYTQVQTKFKNAITVDNAGNIWVGFRDIGLGKFDGANWTMFDTANTPMISQKISALGMQNGNIIWVGAQITLSTGNLYSYNGSAWTDYSASINNSFVNAICANTTTVWIGTRAGIFKYNGSTWTNLTVANSNLASDTVLSLAIDPSGNILAGTQRGLSVQNGTSWTNYNSTNIGFPSNIITAVYADVQNGIWLGTAAGVGRFQLPYFVPLDTIMPTSAIIYPQTCSSISRGPHGGVIFSGRLGALIEVAWNRPTIYYDSISNNTFLCYNPTDGKTWMVNKFVGSYFFKAFDGNGYNGLGLGNTPYNCRYLDVNNVRAAMMNRGDMHWNGPAGPYAQYEVPKGGGASTIFASSLWIGGLDNGGGLHEAAMTYRQTGIDYFPGPLDTTNGSADSSSAWQYDYIWRISKLKIQEFQYYWSTGAVQSGNYEPDYDILTWPAQGTGNFTRNMAPFVDVDGNGIYNPLTGGDYPQIKGDEMLYCIYNDNLALHLQTGTTPMKVEVHESAYAYFCPSVADSEKTINYSIFYDYKIFNRSNLNYNSVYLGMWQDVDLGQYDDDFVGCISSDNFSFACNGDANDGSSAIPTINTYGAHPPILSLAVLDGPIANSSDGIDNDNDGTIDEVGEKNLMTGFHYYNNDLTIMGNPQSANDFYLYMSGKWRDSTNVTFGGNGYGGTTSTQFMYDGLMYDTSAWTEASAGNIPFDRRGLTNCGPFNLNAGQAIHLVYAHIFSRDTTAGPPDTLYYDQAVNDVRRIRSFYQNNNAPSCVQWNVGINESPNNSIYFSLYPNPSSNFITINYKPQSKNSYYEIFDLTGRMIASEKINNYGETVFSVQDFSTGIYLVRVMDGEKVAAMKFIRE